MEPAVYLYDAKGKDEELKIEEVNLQKLNDRQLLWIDIGERDRQMIEQIVGRLGIEDVPIHSIIKDSSRPKVDKFEDFFRFFIVSVQFDEKDKLRQLKIDFVVGKNYVISIHDGEIDYFKEFRDRENGETHIGELDAESFIATLIDLHIVSYFRALEDIENRVDRFDEKVLRADLPTDVFLSEMVALRRDVSKLRRWFLPHRDVFYSLSRPDFLPVSQSDSVEHFRMVNQHFESAVDAIEDSRQRVLSVFDLYATKSDQEMNQLIRKLTFFTFIVGSLGVIAGIFGMNYEFSYFKSELGFWVTIGLMILLAISLSIIAKVRGWL